LWTSAFLGSSDAMIPAKSLPLASLVSLFGAFALMRRRSTSVALLLVIPFVVVGAASLMHRWPLLGRLLVFLVPALVLLLGAGLWSIAGALPAPVRGASLALVGLLVAFPAMIHDARGVRVPRRRDDVALLVRDFLATRTTPAVMYLMGHSTPSWLFYSGLWRQRDGEAFRVAAERASPSGRFPHRECMHQGPTLRVVFGTMPQSFLTDSALAAEAVWLAAQPERDIWLLTLSYEREAGAALAGKLVANGATKVEERARGDGSLRHFRFPELGSGRLEVACDAGRDRVRPASS
jgi:hypothetical protein